MKTTIKVLATTALFTAAFFTAAYGNTASHLKGKKAKRDMVNPKSLASDCQPATSQAELDINNIRTTMLNGGDLWWDLDNARYEVPKLPKGSGQARHSIFQGSVWMGGFDASGQLKVAAQTYRQDGNDYWPGPLNPDGSITSDICKSFDKHWKVNKEEIENFIDQGTTTDNILNWPGKGNPNQSFIGNRDLADFFDANSDGIYNPSDGDYPMFDANEPDAQPDQMIWWIFNDKGNSHTQTQGIAIGMEVHATAFAYKTGNELNNMTFYRYQLINKGTSTLSETYFGHQVDPDLGCYVDDFVGCDTLAEMGIIYNGDDFDEDCSGVLGYGSSIPMLGIDYFQGPKDTNGLILGMSSFIYYNNSTHPTNGEPDNFTHFYNYLSGKWKDGQSVVFGGTGVPGSPGSTNNPTKYMYPDDPNLPAPKWSECSAGNVPQDRRFVQSSGPFTLLPGALNSIVVAAVWVPDAQVGTTCPSFTKLKSADRLAQALFDSKFKAITGPPAPKLDMVELENELILVIKEYKKTEGYQVVDRTIGTIYPDSFFTFQGYKIYQVINESISSSDLDPEKDNDNGKLIAVVDIKDGILGPIRNYAVDPDKNSWFATTMVDLPNKGIQHTFRIKDNKFASASPALINHRKYHFLVIPYAYNNFADVNTLAPDPSVSQVLPYLEGSSALISGIPHKPINEALNAQYGDIFEITRVEGKGNGGLFTEITEASLNEIVTNGSAKLLNYKQGAGPVNVYIYDPKKLISADFKLYVSAAAPSTSSTFNAKTAKWFLFNETTGENDTSTTTLYDNSNQPIVNDQIISKYGFAINIQQAAKPGVETTSGNGSLGGTITYADKTVQWLTGVKDGSSSNLSLTSSGDVSYNWIQPSYGGGSTVADPEEDFSKIINGTWAPYGLCAIDVINSGPGWNDINTSQLAQLSKLESVDIIFTSDKSKWSKCIVVETGNIPGDNEGLAQLHDLRKGTSKDQNGSIISGTGYSYFPGYAVNVGTGERLNIFFGENSGDLSNNGRDMMWNPTSGKGVSTNLSPGGKHFIYVHNTLYDGCAALSNLNTLKSQAYRDVIWVSMSYLRTGFSLKSLTEGIIPTETKVSLRVTRPYDKLDFTADENKGLPKYQFSTKGAAADIGNVDSLKSKLSLINVVPNPYYAYSQYERTSVDNRVKFINLPNQCTISIYGMDGNLVRKIIKNDASLTSVDWDLTNQARIPISSGLYVIHINADGIGERTIKWFGVMRPTDFETF